jgi:hypothetical protein
VPGRTLTTEAFVIERRPPADAFQTFGLFSAEHGNLLALQRIPRRPSPSHVTPDLFDTIAALLESSNEGRTWFVKELRVAVRRAAIGRSYDALRFASALAAVVSRNAVDEGSRPGVERLLRTALDAFGVDARPDIVYLKSLYLFARDEGYPVKQEWLPSLPPADRLTVSALLGRPLSEQDCPADEVARMRDALEAYLSANTEIVIP